MVNGFVRKFFNFMWLSLVFGVLWVLCEYLCFWLYDYQILYYEYIELHFMLYLLEQWAYVQ